MTPEELFRKVKVAMMEEGYFVATGLAPMDPNLLLAVRATMAVNAALRVADSYERKAICYSQLATALSPPTSGTEDERRTTRIKIIEHASWYEEAARDIRVAIAKALEDS